MKTFSNEMNNVFDILNKLTGTDVISTDVVENQDGVDFLHIKVCGRDTFWDEKLHCVDMGMWEDNPFIDVMKSLSSYPTLPHPMLHHRDDKEKVSSMK